MDKNKYYWDYDQSANTNNELNMNPGHPLWQHEQPLHHLVIIIIISL